MAKVELKQPVVEEISAGIKDAQSVVLVDYRGLTVEQDTQLRKSLREAGVSYKVYKNTMMNFAFKGTQFEGLSEYLEGPSAMAYSTEDATAPARVLAQFAKTADKLEIKAGVVEGTVYDAKGMAAIANIPSRDVLISKLLGSLQSPITNFARVMNQLAEKGGEGTVDTYVPFRNGLFLSFAAAVAVSVGAAVIYYGAHADDAAGRAYPDCTPEFETAMNQAIYEGSGRTCRLEAPLLNWNKAGVVKEGLRLHVPYELTWSCYEGGDVPCGVCGTCRDRAAAFAANSVADPALGKKIPHAGTPGQTE